MEIKQYNFSYVRGLNIWKLVINNKHLWNQQSYKKTCCLYDFTSRYAHSHRTLISGTLFLRYYIDLQNNLYPSTSNYLICSEEEQKRYLDLCKEVIDFDYIIDSKKNYYYPNTKCLKIKFENCNYVRFMLILTLVRYCYEFPASKFISDVLKFYNYLEGKEHIITCIHCVFKAFGVTHGHETQTLFPYISRGIPYILSKEKLISLSNEVSSLFSIFEEFDTFDYRFIGYERFWDPKKFDKQFNKRLEEYLNLYNICRLKSM